MADIANSLGTDFFLGSKDSALTYEIMRKCHYKIDILNIDGRVAVQDSTFPRIELEETEVYYYNDRIKLASKPNPGDFNVQVLDYVEPKIVKQFWDWFTEIYDPKTRNMGYASNYKRSAVLMLFDPNAHKIREWTLSGIWPKNSPTPSQAYSYNDGQEAVKIEMAFAVDLMTLTMG